MKGLSIYVDGGKGHYVPAKAVADRLNLMGHQTELVEFFSLFHLKTIGRINKNVWRLMLKMPKYEVSFSKHNDSEAFEMKLASSIICMIRKGRVKKILSRYKPDFIFTTHPYPNRFISEIFKKMGVDIPVYYFATDVFSAPMAAINPLLHKFYISTGEGLRAVEKLGQREETLSLVPFPLQAAVADTPRLEKQEARRKLGIDGNLFTMQLNLGGEGLGTLSLLKELAKSPIDMQILILGGISDDMRLRLERIASSMPEGIKMRIIGFVSNVNEYLYASDIIAGRAGINTIVEAIYARRPFLITELVYTVLASADFIVKHGVGWNASLDAPLQAKIVRDLATNPQKLDEMERNFDNVPISYGADKLAEILISDVKSYTVD